MIKNSYDSLQNYEFEIDIKFDFLKKKNIELIDIFESNIGENKYENDLFNFEKQSEKYNEFSVYLSNLNDEKFNNLFRDLWFFLDLPNDFHGLMRYFFDKKNKINFIADIFSNYSGKTKKEIILYFDEETNALFRKNSEKNEQTRAEQIFYEYKKHKFIYDKNVYDPQDPNADVSYFINSKFNYNFFTHDNDDSYSILPSIISILLIGVFIILTILTLSVFTALYLEIFIDDESYEITKRIKKFFLLILEFYQTLPEILLAIISFSFFIYSLGMKSDSILFFGINLSLIVFPILVNISLRSLKLLTYNLKESLHMAESKVKFIISDILPMISPYVVFHAIKTLSYITNFGLLFFIAGNFDYSKVSPSGFSDDMSTIMKDIFITGIFHQENLHLLGPMVLTLLMLNLFLHSLAFFVKRFITINLH